MAVKYSGILRFADEIKAEINLAADGTVEKAVVINGDGVETPIGGGGASDFTTAEVTIVNSADTNMALIIPAFYEASPPFDLNAYVKGYVSIGANATIVLNVPLYKGHCTIVKGNSGDRMQGTTVATSYTVTSGSATLSTLGVDITGDCTITLAAASEG